METAKDEEQGQGYLTPVLSHALFPAQASAEAKKLYAALQEYAKRYSWVGMGRIHKGLREQVRDSELTTESWGSFTKFYLKCYWYVLKNKKKHSNLPPKKTLPFLQIQVRLNDLSTIQKPHLFFLPDVPSVPFFPRDAHRHDIEVLEANYPAILAEFQAVYQRGTDSKSGWTCLGPKVHNKDKKHEHRRQQSEKNTYWKCSQMKDIILFI